MSGARLRKQCVAVPGSTVLITCYQQPNLALHDAGNAKLVGHVFATVWEYDGGNFCFSFVSIPVAHVHVRKSWLGHPAGC